MRKIIVTFAMAAALSVGLASGALAAPRASHARCGTTYTPSCTKPRVSYKRPSPRCVKLGPLYKLPNIKFVSNAGLREIQVLMGKSLKTIKFKKLGPTQYVLKGFKVHTTGLITGAHQITIRVKDVRGKTVTKQLRFSICASKPVFTG